MKPRFRLVFCVSMFMFLAPLAVFAGRVRRIENPSHDRQASGPSLAAKAQNVLKTHCYRCHGQNGAAKGKFGYVLDRDKLIARNKIEPGNANGSLLFQRVHKGEMPPAGKKPRPGKNELAILQQWIDAGAPSFAIVKKPRVFIANDAVFKWIYADLQTIPARHRRFARYFTLAHLANAGLSDEDLQATRRALSKLINSLSWHPRITRPIPIDKSQTVFRIDLRHYKWNASLWDRLVTAYPYRLRRETVPVALRKATQTELPYLRADWFIATASRPPFYYDLLEMPTTDRGLERLLQVDVIQNIKEETAIRAGFNNSGVSQNNRLIERHDASYGAYWRSYDFAKNTERQNLFEHPLGPSTGSTSFAHSGGESIFNLPNGLHAFLLVNALGNRIDKGPIEIVSDPRRPDRSVEAGISCMSCHVRGFIPKADQIRAHVEKNRNSFSKDDAEAVLALYLPKEKMQKLLDEDNRRYQKALALTGVSINEPEPINLVTRRYESTLDLAAAAAEVGLKADDFLQRLKKAPALARNFGALRDKSGSIQRQVFEENFEKLAEAFGLDQINPNTLALAATPVKNAFTGHTGSVLSIDFSPDGRFAISGSSDRTIRLWEVATGKEIHCFKGHTDEVAAVRFSPDGTFIVSGSRDRTVRVWKVAHLTRSTGVSPVSDSTSETLVLRGHTDAVRAVAVSRDGKYVLSGGDDRAVRLWDLATGKELRVFVRHPTPVRSVAFAPNGRRALSAGTDGVIRLWNIKRGRELKTLEGHTGAVFDVAFSPNGRRLISGGNDCCVRIWDARTGRELLCLNGHANAVIRVAFAANGRHALSGSSQYQKADRFFRKWDVKTGRELANFGRRDTSVGCVAFSPDGRTALTGGTDGSLGLWRWSD